MIITCTCLYGFFVSVCICDFNGLHDYHGVNNVNYDYNNVFYIFWYIG